MLVTDIHKFFTEPIKQQNSPKVIFWLTVSIVLTTHYAWLGLQKAFSSTYIIQDDARQHLFWMQRFLDPDLFSHDLIADYFQSVAPAGYTFLYHLAAIFGLNPIIFNKILPLILCLITTYYCFFLCIELLPVPFTGFVGALLLSQNLWMQDGLASGTPKAFIYPIFLASLYYLLKRSLLGIAVSVLLMGLFYPSLVFILAILIALQVFKFERFFPKLSSDKKDYWLFFIGIGVAILVLLPYAIHSSEFGPTITKLEAKNLPEFISGNRSSFFHDNDDLWRYYFNASRSGIRLPSALRPFLVYLGLLLPIIIKFPDFLPLSNYINKRINILSQLLLASLLMFVAAHLLLFKLHLPSRYTQHSLRIILVIAASICLVLLLDTLLSFISQFKHVNKFSLISISQKFLFLLILLINFYALIIYPYNDKGFIGTGYFVGKNPELYQFFQNQPKDIMVASLAKEANNIPSFAQRSILVGREYAIPYHLGYYDQFRQRTLDLIEAYYTPSVPQLNKFMADYGVDFWLLDHNTFQIEYLANNRWLKQYQPEAKQAVSNLQKGLKPALATFMDNCVVFEKNSLVVLDSQCMIK